jgi:hypothetical protein
MTCSAESTSTHKMGGPELPATFHTVSPDIWQNRAFRRMPCDVKAVYFYVLTCPERVSEGLFKLAPESIAAMTSLTLDQVTVGLQELEVAELISWDSEHELVLDRNALQVNPVPQPKPGKRADGRATGFAKRFVRYPPSRLCDEFLALARQYSPYLITEIEQVRAAIHELDAPSGVGGGSPEGPPGTGGGSLEVPQRGDERRGDARSSEVERSERSASSSSDTSISPRRSSTVSLSSQTAQCHSCSTSFYAESADVRLCGWCREATVAT